MQPHLRRKRERQAAAAAAAQVFPDDIARYDAEGWLSEAHQPLLELVRVEAGAIARDLGGADLMSAMERSLLAEHTRLGLLEALLTLQCLRKPERTEDVSRVATVSTARVRILQTLGIKRRDSDVVDLRTYVAERVEVESDDGGDNAA